MNIDTKTYNKVNKYPNRNTIRGHPREGLYRGYGSSKRYASAWRTSFRAILIHTTNGNAKSKFENEADFLLNSEDVSANYLVGQQHQIAQIVDPRVIAWHSGDCYDNDFENPTSIGIEIHWTPSLGALPASVIHDVDSLVRYLLTKYPTINKIDTHRNQAKPKGRKIDPSGWDDVSFNLWRDSLIKDPVKKYTVITRSNIRKSPSTLAEIVGKAEKGDEFIIYETTDKGEIVEGSSTWARVGDNKWIWKGLLIEV